MYSKHTATWCNCIEQNHSHKTYHTAESAPLWHTVNIEKWSHKSNISYRTVLDCAAKYRGFYFSGHTVSFNVSTAHGLTNMNKLAWDSRTNKNCLSSDCNTCFKKYVFFPWFVPSLSLQASRECQSKEKLLEQGFRSAFREFQQWFVNAKINTAKCFDVPQNLNEASSSLQKIQV